MVGVGPLWINPMSLASSRNLFAAVGQLLPMTRGKTLIPFLSVGLLSEKGWEVAKITFNWLKVHIKISLSRLMGQCSV